MEDLDRYLRQFSHGGMRGARQPAFGHWEAEHQLVGRASLRYFEVLLDVARMNLADRLRANLDLALAKHRCNELSRAVAEHRGTDCKALTITTLAPLAGSTRWTLAGLGGHTRISTFQGIAGALGCTVAELVEDVEPTVPVDLGQPPDRLWILYAGSSGAIGLCTDSATILVSCDDEDEARTYAGSYGDMACYSYKVKGWGRELVDEQWEWDWLKAGGFEPATEDAGEVITAGG